MFKLVSKLTWLSVSSGLHLVFLLDTSTRHTSTWVTPSSGPVMLQVYSHLWGSWTSCPAALLPVLLSGNIVIMFTGLYATFHLWLSARVPCTAVKWCWFWWRSLLDWGVQPTAAEETETCKTFLHSLWLIVVFREAVVSREMVRTHHDLSDSFMMLLGFFCLSLFFSSAARLRRYPSATPLPISLPLSASSPSWTSSSSSARSCCCRCVTWASFLLASLYSALRLSSCRSFSSSLCRAWANWCSRALWFSWSCARACSDSSRSRSATDTATCRSLWNCCHSSLSLCERRQKEKRL